MQTYYTYVLANRARSFQIGVTHNLMRRVGRHRAMDPRVAAGPAGVFRLVYYEKRGTARAAMERARQLERLTQGSLSELIAAANPSWRDMAADWFESRRA